MLSDFIRLARSLGFAAVGFSRPGRPLHMDAFIQWLRQGRHGEMGWLERNLDVREDPARLLPGSRTLISLARPYGWDKPATPDGFTVSRYARPDAEDYHQELKRLCRGLAAWIREAFPGGKTRICVDSAPLLERSFAFEAGLGWIGKNGMLIVPGTGSRVFLAEILTTADLPIPDRQPAGDLCGACTRCMDACPAGALAAPRVVDASRCLSYRTIEWKGEVDPETAGLMGDCFVGCDRCQEACPHNPLGEIRRILLPPAGELLQMDGPAFSDRFGGTALARPGLEKIQSNLRAMGVRSPGPARRIPRPAPHGAPG
ncbi:MAG: tRNA epoxyqueuosine(34) reductase QueG [Deltaproteobacteria bacterium]|nr:tRNA epoxyqueuosine(34) reductase QueG [Deltaproteobacteria bacterium]